MKMGFLLKNNARKGMGEKGVLKKGEEKECSKRGEEKEAEKRPPKFANSKTDGRLGGNSQILKAGETLFKNFWTIPRCSHNVNKSE
ncbi:hypothetical protein [Segatella sp.]|uniref:hypothetical protein n=1 Tax=Segatella sp. TaxID=2974253 RepID=UPI003A94D3E4